MAADDRISELMLRWEELREQGREVSPEELCRDCPEMVDTVREEIDALKRLSPLIDSSPESGPDSPPGPRPLVARPLPMIPGYEILNWLGEGGMGVVYRARDLTLGRVVALKVLRAGTLATPRQIERFRSEAKAMALLDHPNIVPIYEPGEPDGLPYFTLKFVEGGSLTDHQDRLHADVRAAVAVLAKVARAVEYLHGRLIHRDLKPSNVLLDTGGEPYVSDFGLAKMLEGGLELTRTGEAPGTRPYMAPEQVAGWLHRISPATDIWSLGVILFEVLTGRRPFAGRTEEDLSRRICEEEPLRPRSLRPDLPADLERICLRCLQKDACQRYPSAAALADDLEQWLRVEQAKDPGASRVRRAWREARRHPLSVMAPALLGLVAALASAPALTPAPHEKEPRKIDDAVTELLRELHEKRVVTLIPENGIPKWSPWRLNEVVPAPIPQRGIRLHALKMSLLELLPAVPGESYCFSADIQHEDGMKFGSEVGIFFGYGSRETRRGEEHSFYRLGFSDTNVEAKQGNEMSMRINLLYQTKPGRVDSFASAKTGPYVGYQPSVVVPGPERRLAVKIRQTAVWTRFGDKPWAGPLPLTRLKEHENGLCPFADVGRPNFGLSRALGLYLSNARATFRNVKVELLRDPN